MLSVCVVCVVRILADGSGHWCSGRIDADASRRTPRALRSSSLFVFVVCRSSHFGLWALGFGFFLYFGFWLASAAERRVRPSPVAHAHAHAHAQTRPSCDGTDSAREGSRARDTSWLGGGGGGRPEDSARTTVCLGSLGVVAVLCVESRESRVENRESRVKSRELSHQPTAAAHSPSQATLSGSTSFICMSMTHRI